MAGDRKGKRVDPGRYLISPGSEELNLHDKLVPLHSMQDGLTKFNDLPAEAGGSGDEMSD